MTRQNLIDLSLIIFTMVAFHLVFFTHYFGIQDGWGNAYAYLMESGKVPYRDFYLFTQPFSAVLSYELAHFFGNTVLTLRTFGLCERVLITCLIYYLYRQIAPRPLALLASIVSVIFSTGTLIDMVYDYTQSCLLYLLLSCSLISTYIKQRTNHVSFNLLFWAGVTGGMAFIIKQSDGMIPLVFAGFLCFYSSLTQRKLTIKPAGYYALGMCLPILLTWILLYRVNALSPYVNQVFFSAAATKGGLFTILFGAFFHNIEWLTAFLPFAIFLVSMFVSRRDATLSPSRKMVFALILFSLAAGFVCLHIFTFTLSDLKLFNTKNKFILFTLETMLLLCGYLFVKACQTPLSSAEWQWFLISMMAFLVIYTHGFSSVVYNVYAISIAFGVWLIMMYSLPSQHTRIKNTLLSLFCFIVITCTWMQHYYWPYAWWGWKESPVNTSVLTSTLPSLSGLTLSPYTSRVIHEITDIVEQNATRSDSIYVFPHMPIFYVLTQHLPPTFALVNYFDVCSDHCAEEDAQRVLKAQPKVLIIEKFPNLAWTYHEDVFRTQPSGQRQILKVIDQLTASHHYTLAASYPSTQLGYTLEVWVRRS